MRVRIVPTMLATLLLMGGLCHGQSLGEAARQAQQEKQKDGKTAKRVISTDDLSPTPVPKPTSDSKKDVQRPLPYKTVGTADFTPADWTRSIKAQKDWIAHLQEAAEKLKTMRKVDLNKVATDPAERNFWEERSILEQLASEIPEQQKQLAKAQDDARKAGMPVAVWDPQ